MFGIGQDAPYHLRGALRKQLRKTKERFDIHTELDADTQRDPELQHKIDRMVGRIYAEMTIVDGKVGALTQAAALLLFIASLAVSSSTSLDKSNLQYSVVVASFVILLIAILFCLSVVYLYGDYPLDARLTKIA